MAPSMARGRAWGAVLVLACLPSCAINDLAFREDTRLSITSPSDREEVSLPMTLEWETTDDLPAGTTFAVFIDRSPPPPGRSVRWLFRDDDVCERDPTCPDEEFLADRHVYVTDETSVTIANVRRGRDDDRRELHEAAIVLIGRDGDRLGEAAFIREFAVEREDR